MQTHARTHIYIIYSSYIHTNIYTYTHITHGCTHMNAFQLVRSLSAASLLQGRLGSLQSYGSYGLLNLMKTTIVLTSIAFDRCKHYAENCWNLSIYILSRDSSKMQIGKAQLLLSRSPESHRQIHHLGQTQWIIIT